MPNKGKQAIPHVSEHVAFNIAGTVRNIKKQKPSHRTFLNKKLESYIESRRDHPDFRHPYFKQYGHAAVWPF